MARASIEALRSDIELQSVLRYRSTNSRCANGEVHIERLGPNCKLKASAHWDVLKKQLFSSVGPTRSSDWDAKWFRHALANASLGVA